MHLSEIPSLPNNSDIAGATRVKLSAGFLIAAGDEEELGTTAQRVFAADSKAAVVPKTVPGVRQMIAGGAITKHAEVFAAAAGRIAATGTRSRGYAMEAASGLGSIIPVFVP